MRMLRFLDTGKNDGPTNMAIDEALASSFYKDSYVAVRLYGWAKPSVSIGYFQKMDEIKKTFIAQIGADENEQMNTDKDEFDFVRRPTGGGAVLHNGNTTFSVVVKRQDKPIEWYYKLVRQAIMSYIGTYTDGFWIGQRDLPRSNFCHNNITKHDVVIWDKKISGFSARRFHDTILLQGYIEIGYNNFLKYALLNIFEKVIKVAGVMDNLTEQEDALYKILQDKYCSDAWNYKR